MSWYVVFPQVSACYWMFSEYFVGLLSKASVLDVATDYLLALTSAQVWILLGEYENVASDVGLDGGFPWVLPFSPPQLNWQFIFYKPKRDNNEYFEIPLLSWSLLKKGRPLK